MIVGGSRVSNLEVLNERKHLSCNIPSYPMTISVHASTVTTSGILICGGYSKCCRWLKNCYEYRSSSKKWTRMPSMPKKRANFDMIYLKQKVYAVGGLYNYIGFGITNSMDIFDSISRTWTNQPIPFSIGGHCITQLSTNQFMLIGGINCSSTTCRVSKNVMTKNISIQHFYSSKFHCAKYFLHTILF